MNILAEGHIHGQLMTLILVLIKKIIALFLTVIHSYVALEKQKLIHSTVNVLIQLNLPVSSQLKIAYGLCSRLLLAGSVNTCSHMAQKASTTSLFNDFARARVRTSGLRLDNMSAFLALNLKLITYRYWYLQCISNTSKTSSTYIQNVFKKYIHVC